MPTNILPKPFGRAARLVSPVLSIVGSIMVDFWIWVISGVAKGEDGIVVDA